MVPGYAQSDCRGDGRWPSGKNWTPSETQPESDKSPQRYHFCYVNNVTDMDCKYCFLSP